MKSINQHSIKAYDALVKAKLREHRGNRDLAMAQSVGSATLETFASQGMGHVAVLKHHGLQNGMTIYDLGCGCGRTAQALQRSGWTGTYKGADIVGRLVKELKAKCRGYEAIVHRQLTIAAPDNSLDIVYHWSVFTHLFPEECHVYMADSFRALKPGGKLVFSFLELENPEHRPLFNNRARLFRKGATMPHLDTFLHRDWIRLWADELGYSEPQFTDGRDETNHPAFWQSLAAMGKPMAAHN